MKKGKTRRYIAKFLVLAVMLSMVCFSTIQANAWCSVHTYTNFCDSTCNVCEAVRSIPGHSWTASGGTTYYCQYCYTLKCSVEGHIYTNNCDTLCNFCTTTRPITHSYTDCLDTSCNICGAVKSTTHTYDYDCDATCNVCGIVRQGVDHLWFYPAPGCPVDVCRYCGATRPH